VAVPTRIVAIGASAGGLESLEHLFRAVPPDTGMAFVVIQHLAPDFKSQMAELLARQTKMRVTMATEGVAIESDHIYLLPPAKQMIVQGERLLLTDRPPSSFLLPIDTFFRALAQDVGDRAVAVVLSGTGSDGSRGVVDVKDAGGLVLVESGSAKFDGMPQAALATGVVDLARTAHELGQVLATLPAPEDYVGESVVEDLSPSESILALLHERYGIDSTFSRTGTVARRILRRVNLTRVPSVEDYVARLRSTPAELDTLYRDLLIGVSHFFRDPEAFEALEREVVPKILDVVGADEDLRVWVAGCATGEEAYTVAMVFLDAIAARRGTQRLRVLATDVHPGSLEIAAKGVYAPEQTINVSAERIERYFTSEDGMHRVAPALRQVVMFTRHDVTRDAPFTKVQLITCRNMLIYLQPPAQKTVLSLFHFGLAPNGYLMLGASENAAPLAEELISIDNRWRLFQKRRDVPLVTELKLPGSQLGSSGVEGSDTALLGLYDQLLDMFMPPGFLIAESRELVDSFGGAERLLRARSRRPSKHILELVDGELRIAIGGALHRVFKDGVAVSYTHVPIELDGQARATVVARPVPSSHRGPRHAIVTLKDIVRGAEAADSAPPVTELADTQQRLDLATTQLALSNEQLQAANEELQSANEELQSSNEELQSVNEELFTVNAEHQRQIGELRELSDDVLQLLEGSDVGTLLLDDELRIRRFTSRVAPLFRFRDVDTGRQLADFAHTLERPQLLEDIAQVKRTGEPLALELSAADGHRYFLRISRIAGGIALTIIDVTLLDASRSTSR